MKKRYLIAIIFSALLTGFWCGMAFIRNADRVYDLENQKIKLEVKLKECIDEKK